MVLFVWVGSATAQEQRCNELGSVCQCSERLDTASYVCSSGNCSVGNDLSINPTDTNSKQCYGGDAIALGEVNSPVEPNQGQFLSTPDETGMPPGNTVGKVWRWNRGQGFFNGYGNSTLRSSTKRLCYRHYLRLSPNYDGGNIATDPTSPNCNAGKFNEMDWTYPYSFQASVGG